MRASHIALLSLAASTAAPVFAAPLPYFNARSTNEGAALGARGSHDGCNEGKSEKEKHTPQSGDDIPGRISARGSVEDFMTALANVGARESDDQQEDARRSSDNAIGDVERDIPRDVTESLAARATTDDILASILSSRDLGPGAGIEARNWLSSLMEIGMGLVNQILRREVTPEQMLAARNGAGDFVDSIINRRDTDSNGFATLINALASSRREDTSDGLAARDNWDDLVATLNNRELGFKRDMQARGLLTSILSWGLHKLMSLSIHLRDLKPDELAGRDTNNPFDEFFNNYMSHTAREPSPQQESESHAADELAARDGWEDLLNSLNTRRDYVDDFLNDYMSSHSTREQSPRKETQAVDTDPSGAVPLDGGDPVITGLNSRDSLRGELAGRDAVDDYISALLKGPAAREPSPQQETHARDIPDGHETVARDATNDFIKALLQSRDSSKELTPDEVLTLASLGSRALDGLD